MRIAAVLVLCACGRINFDAGGGNVNDAADAATGPCESTAVLADNFAGTAIDTSRWNIITATGITVAQNDELVFTFGANVPPIQDTLLVQRDVHDIRGACLTITQLAAPDPSTEAYSDAGFLTSGNDEVSFEVQTGLFQATYFHPGNNFHVVRSVPYDASLHRVVRIREQAGTFYWDTSSDGVTFTAFASSAATGFPSATGMVQLSAATDQVAATNAGTVVYGSVTEVLP